MNIRHKQKRDEMIYRLFSHISSLTNGPWNCLLLNNWQKNCSWLSFKLPIVKLWRRPHCKVIEMPPASWHDEGPRHPDTSDKPIAARCLVPKFLGNPIAFCQGQIGEVLQSDFLQCAASCKSVQRSKCWWGVLPKFLASKGIPVRACAVRSEPVECSKGTNLTGICIS